MFIVDNNCAEFELEINLILPQATRFPAFLFLFHLKQNNIINKFKKQKLP